MWILKPLAFISFFSSINSFGADMCIAKNTSLALPANIENLASVGIKSANIEYAQSDMKDFCQRNMLLRFINAQKNAPKDCDKKSTKELETLAVTTAYGKLPDAWEAGLIPTERTTEKSIIRTLINLSYKNDGYDYKYDNISKDLNQNAISYNTDEKNRIRENIKTLKNDGSNDEKVKGEMNSLTLTAVCSELSILKSYKCSSGIESIISKISPKGKAAKFTNLDLWEDVLLDDKYDVGINLTAKKIITRLQGNIKTKDNIFDDFITSFKQSGMSDENAKIASIKVLGLIANGSNNTASRIQILKGDSGKDNIVPHNKDAALGLIASSLQYLDYKNSQNNLPLYSLPLNIKTTCSTKNYHFWMSAYLSWSMVNELKIDPKVAAMVVFTLQKGYQVNRDIGRANSIESFSGVLGKDPFDPVHQIIRTDLAYASAGAFWGGSNFKKNIDLDSVIVDLLKKAEPKNPLTKEEKAEMNKIALYKHWSDIFAPNVAFDKIDSQK